MKKIFPVISFLVFISALGLIYFQYKWISQSIQDKKMQFVERLKLATAIAANDVVDQRNKQIPFNIRRNNDVLLPFNAFPTSVARNFSRDEIRNIINKAFDKADLRELAFEFSVFSPSIVNEDLQSEQFYKWYIDSTRHTALVIPLASSPVDNINYTPEEQMMIVVPNRNSILWDDMFWMILGAIVFTCIIFTAFFITIRALLNQKKLSEIKSDFINNMTHEFKTPLATISLAVDALRNEKVINDREKLNYFSGIIKDENKRMNKQVETILDAAMTEKHEVSLNMQPVHATELINAALNNIQLPVKEKNGILEVDFNATVDCIKADDVHFTNIINNLLDNAVKYSGDNPLKIKLTTTNVNQYIRIKIEDSGIGMNKETAQRIFEKFYRAHTGNLHNVKGFGLGLSYVKSIVEAHKGKIKVESTPGKGSCFILDFPLIKKEAV